MNYTENYHLPQWDETDRIMRVDFNRMCADIDEGLDKNKQATGKLSQHCDAQDKLLSDRLLRLAYNQYLAAQAVEPFPPQIGVFYQDAARDFDTQNGGSLWEGARFVCSGLGGYNFDTFFRQYARTLSNLKMNKAEPAKSSPMLIEICAPAATKLSKFNLSGNISDNVPNTPAPFLLTLTNQDTGEVEHREQIDLVQKEQGILLVTYLQPVTLYLYGGSHYLLKIEPIGDPVFSSDLSFTYGNGTIMMGMGDGKRCQFNASYTMREREESSMGLLILRCNAGGPDGRLTVRWDGEALTPDYVRPCRNGQGLALREMIYVRRGAIPAETSFSVHFDTGEKGTLWFQDWGAILL